MADLAKQFSTLNLTTDVEQLRTLKHSLARSKDADLSARLDPAGSVLCSLLRPVIALNEQASDFHVKLQSCEILSTWLTKAINAARRDRTMLAEIRTVLDDTHMQYLQSLLPNNWENSGPLQSEMRDILQKSLVLGKLMLPDECSNRQREMLRKLLSMSSLQKSVYLAIDVLVKQLGGEAITEIEPDFFERRMGYMTESSITTPLSRIMLSVVECQASDTWQIHLVNTLLREDALLSYNVLTFLLPLLFKQFPQSFGEVVRLVRSSSVPEVTKLSMLLKVLQKAKDLSLITDLDTATLERFGLAESLFDELLKSTNQDLRLSALSLLVSHPRPTTSIPVTTYAILRRNLRGLFLETDLEPRKEVINSIRDLLARFYASNQYVIKLVEKAKRKENDQEVELCNAYTSQSRDFAIWLSHFLRSRIEPGETYQATYTALQTMHIASSLGWTSLAESIVSDRYSAFPTGKKSGLYDRPLPFDPELFTDATYRLLLDRLTDAFDDNRALAMSLLKALPDRPDFLLAKGGMHLLKDNSDRFLYSNRGRDADCAARSCSFMLHSCLRNEKYVSILLNEPLKSSISIQYMLELLKGIDSDISTAALSIVNIAEDRPLHGRLATIHAIMRDVDWTSERIEDRNNLRQHIVDTCTKTWDLVKHVLCNDSPEGNVPELCDLDQGIDRPDASQLILSFCWRSLRETSGLLSSVITSMPCNHTLQESRQTVSDVGQMFLTWLTNVRHRGAFSAISYDFVELCKALLNVTGSSELPLEWLQQMLTELRSVAHGKDITRRSGGLPMSIIALMVAEVESRATGIIVETGMADLISLAREPCVQLGPVLELPQVHAMNTLKDIFKESRLSHRVQQYLEECAEIAVTGFSSTLWSIRNCSLMLFSSVTKRSFGGRKSRMESLTYNLTTKEYFDRFPKLLKQLIKELETAVDALYAETSVTTSLCPILTLLSQLEYSANSDDSDMKSIQLLIARCAYSKVWQVRDMAAEAIPTFTGVEHVESRILEILASMQKSLQQNHLHGCLLTLSSLLVYWTARSPVLTTNTAYLQTQNAFYQCFATCVEENKCASTQAAYLQLYLDSYHHGTGEEHDIFERRVLSFCTKIVMAPVVSDVGAADLALLCTKILLKSMSDNLEHLPSISNLLSNHHPAVRMEVYNTASLDRIPLTPEGQQTLHKLCAHEDQLYLRTAARRCYVKRKVSLVRDEMQITTIMNKLSDSASSSPATEVDILLLGHLISTQKGVSTEDLSVLLARFADENMPESTRSAVLECLQTIDDCRSAVDISKTAALEGGIALCTILLDLLVDDDAQLRNRAALYTCDILGSKEKTSTYARLELMERLTALHPQSSSLRKYLLNLFTYPSQSPDTQQPDRLFVVESQNLWRVASVEAADAMHYLKRMSITNDEVTSLLQWCLSVLNGIDYTTPDGPLGQLSLPQVWQKTARAVIAAEFLAQTSPDTVKEISAALQRTQFKSEQLHFHEHLLASVARILQL